MNILISFLCLSDNLLALSQTLLALPDSTFIELMQELHLQFFFFNNATHLHFINKLLRYMLYVIPLTGLHSKGEYYYKK